MLRVILMLLLIPLFDVVLLAAMAQYVLGWELTVLLVVLTALLGTLLVRAEGRHTISEIQTKIAHGEVPTDELIDGGLLIAAGVLFLSPGFVTDLVGLLLVIPLTRWPLRVATKRWVLTPYIDAKTGGFASGNVYVGGFPNGGAGVGGMGQSGPDGSGGVSDTDRRPGGSADDGRDGSKDSAGFDRDDATDIDFEETDDE